MSSFLQYIFGINTVNIFPLSEIILFSLETDIELKVEYFPHGCYNNNNNNNNEHLLCAGIHLKRCSWHSDTPMQSKNRMRTIQRAKQLESDFIMKVFNIVLN